MTGMRRNNISIESGYLPGRKKPYLFIRHKGCINGVAQFRDEECAEHFWDVFYEMSSLFYRGPAND